MNTAGWITGTREATISPGHGRNVAIDLLRAACILYIVGFWHLVPYTHAFPGYAGVYTECIKDIALGTFVFCSGLLLAGRPVVLAWPGIFSFYRRRVLRIYPLYVVALLGFGVIGMAHGDVIVRALLLVSMFLPPAPYTLWFISMIMCFYLCTPFLLSLTANPRLYLLTAVLLLLTGMQYHYAVHPLDTRLLQYLPCFLLGVAWQRMPELQRMFAGRILRLASGFVLAFLLYRLQHAQELSAAFGRMPAILAGTLLLYLVVARYAGNRQSPLVNRVAYASFCIYLFHRVVFHYAIELYFPVTGTARLLYLVCVVVPVIVILSFAVQRTYDRVLELALRAGR